MPQAMQQLLFSMCKHNNSGWSLTKLEATCTIHNIRAGGMTSFFLCCSLHAAGLPTVKTRVAVTPDPAWPAPDPQHDRKRKQQKQQQLQQDRLEQQQAAAAAGSTGSKKGKGRASDSKKNGKQ